MHEIEEALEEFRAKFAWYEERRRRRMVVTEMDTQVVQGAWNRYVKLRKLHGHDLRLSNKSALPDTWPLGPL
jgi:hypothetical protein